MRKLFWSCAAITVVAAGTVYLAAKHVEQKPYEPAGQTMASWFGLPPAGASETDPVEGGVPAPTPVEIKEPHAALCPNVGEVVAVAEGTLPGHIAIGEPVGSTCQAPMPGAAGECVGPADGAITPCQGEAIAAPLGCMSMGADASPSCPRTMPYCADDVDCSKSHMPYADEEQCEEKACSLFDMMVGCCQAIAAGMSVAPCEQPMDPAETNNNAEPIEPMPTGQDDGASYHNYHNDMHCPYCPYTGRCYPDAAPSPAVPDAAEDKKADDKEPAKKSSKPEKKASLWKGFLIDTMEFRPSDAGLNPFIPGPL